MGRKKVELNPRQNASRRLKITVGHLKKVIDMIDTGAYCIDIMQQTSAVRSAIKKAEEVLLMNHLNHCVANAINSDGKEKAIAELGRVFRKIN